MPGRAATTAQDLSCCMPRRCTCGWKLVRCNGFASLLQLVLSQIVSQVVGFLCWPLTQRMTRTKLGWYWSRSMTLGRFAVLFLIGLVAAIAFKLIWLYWLLAAALLAVLVKLRLNG
jgi:hypothetical protein